MNKFYKYVDQLMEATNELAVDTPGLELPQEPTPAQNPNVAGDIPQMQGELTGNDSLAAQLKSESEGLPLSVQANTTEQFAKWIENVNTFNDFLNTLFDEISQYANDDRTGKAEIWAQLNNDIRKISPVVGGLLNKLKMVPKMVNVKRQAIANQSRRNK